MIHPLFTEYDSVLYLHGILVHVFVLEHLPYSKRSLVPIATEILRMCILRDKLAAVVLFTV